MSAPTQIASALLLAAIAFPVAAQKAAPRPEPAGQLVRDVVWNELHDRECNSHWEYLTTRTAGGQRLSGEQVETAHGIIFRLLSRDGTVLSPAQQQQEGRRIQHLIDDPSAMARSLREHQADERRLASLTRMLPSALVFKYDSPPSGDVAHLSFAPNPAFVPSGYEARIVHALTGTMTVNLRQKRMIDIRGVVSREVDFGFGLLGHVDKGGTFEIHRLQVSSRHWKTNLVDVHVAGTLLMFKTVSRNEREARSDFHRVPVNMTLAQADRLLAQAAASPSVQAELAGINPGEAPAASSAGSSLSSDR